MRERGPEPLGEPGGEVARERGVLEEEPELLGRQAVRDEVLLHLHVEARVARDERGVPEELAPLEHLERLAVALDPDRPLADDEEVLQRLRAGAHEPGAGGVEDHLDRRLDALEERRGERMERRRGAEPGDGVDRDHQKKSVR